MSHVRAALLLLCLCSATIANDPGKVTEIFRNAIDILKENRFDDNLAISPLSLRAALGVLLPGTGGRSAAEIRSFLGTEPAVVRNELLNVMNSTKGPNGEQVLSGATRIFYKKGIEIADDFRSEAEKNFNTEFSEIEPSNISREINNWLKNSTNMTIGLEGVARDSDMVLVNAVWFEDMWKDKFDPQETTDGDFHLTGNVTTNVQFMVKRDAEIVSGKNEVLGAKWILLPYTSGMKMLLVLPLKRFDLAKVIPKITVKDYLEMIRNNKTNNISVAIPQFDVTSRFDGEIALRKLGLNEIFTTRANLSGVTKSLVPLKVGKLVQSCHVRIDEMKTTASAKTIGNFDFHRGSLGFPSVVFFKADEPFLFFCISGDVPVFVGQITRPIDNVG